MSDSLQTPSTTIRYDSRAHYDRETVEAILDAGFVAHVGFVGADGRPVVIPMVYARAGDALVLHGLPATRLMRSLATGIDVCVTVTHLDALVLARSPFHHSVNYRSVVVLGRAELVTDPQEKNRLLDLLVEHLVPERVASLRATTAKDLRGTSVLRVPITEASAKIRSGGPSDEEDDYALPIWAGIVPVTTVYGEPEPDPRNLPGVEVPDHVRRLVSPV